MKTGQAVVAMIFSSLIGGFFAIILMTTFAPGGFNLQSDRPYESIEKRQQVKYTTEVPEIKLPENLDFTFAATRVIPGVVHIKAMYSSGQYSVNPMNGYYQNPTRSSGSGVIISDDGFIVTNHHVIQDAERIEVVLSNNRSFQAKIIGNDPTTDLALIKIDAQDLPFVKYGNSDKVVPGEWVLAIGNPFELNSTVTAGIVSAKARNIGILRDKNNYQIESFIQTDAAVNPGNSGGALVNLQGELIGINTAIATPTGTYAGYSFAVPVALVKKVMDDLLKFGKVQRGLLGVRINDVDARIAKQFKLPQATGIYVSYVNENSAAEDAGILPGDVIIEINEMPVTNVSELQEIVARYRPGDNVKVTFFRDGKIKIVSATLKNKQNETQIIPRDYDKIIEGASFEDLTSEDLTRLDIRGGVRLKKLTPGKWQDAGVKEGFIILSIDKVRINDIADLNKVLEIKNGYFSIEGIYPDGTKRVYGVEWE
jgi:serine protease Do